MSRLKSGWTGLVKEPVSVAFAPSPCLNLRCNVNGRSSEIVAPQDQWLSYSTAATMMGCHNPIQSSVTSAGSCLPFPSVSWLLLFRSLSEIP